jgi:YD repeat-containing protein
MTSYTLQVQPQTQYTIEYSNQRGPQGATGPATTDASLLDSGTVADARLSSNVVLESDAYFGGTAFSTYTAGVLTARTYGDGSTKTYTYNGLGQLTVTVHTLANATVVTLTRTYNADGTLSTIVKS